jgi:hypothetical protein
MAKELTVTLTIDQAKRDDLVKRLGYLRCWIQGFQAGGGNHAPHDADVLRQLQLLLKEAKNPVGVK